MQVFKAKPIFTTDVSIPEEHFHKTQLMFQRLDLASYRKGLVTPTYWTNKLETAATDGIFMYINPEFFVYGCETYEQRVFLLAHEIKHIWLRHVQRGMFYRKRGYVSSGIKFLHNLYNQAADYVINADNVAMGMELIPGVLFDSRFTRNDLTESVYMTLYEEEQKRKEQETPPPPPPTDEGEPDEPDDSQADEPDDESAGDQPDEGSDDQSSDDQSDEGSDDAESGGAGASDEDEGEPSETPSDGHDQHFEPQYDGDEEEQARAAEEDEKRIQKEVDEALDAAKAEGAGEPGRGFQEAGYRHCGKGGPSGINWADRLADVLTRPGRGGKVNWGKLNRRKLMISGVISPTRKGQVDRLILTSDISGSVNDEQRDKFHIEFAALADMLKPTAGTLVLWTNTQVVRADTCMNGAELLNLEAPYGGGTILSSSLDWMRENGINGDTHLVFTDGYTSLEDFQRLAEAGCIIVLDRIPQSYVERRLIESGAEYIVMDN